GWTSLSIVHRTVCTLRRTGTRKGGDRICPPLFWVTPADQLNGCGRGVLAVDGGRIGSAKLGCSPVRVFRNAVICLTCLSCSLRPSCRRAITSTASSRFQ